MEKHKDILNKLCRLCKLSVTTETGYKNKKKVLELKDQINRIFKYDITNDSGDVHPVNVCHVCASKLGGIKSTQKYETVNIADFQPHLEEGCFCSDKYLRRKKSFQHKFSLLKIKEFNLGDIESIAKSKGFICLISSDEKSTFATYDEQDNVLKLTASIYSDFKWNVYTHGKEVMADKCPLLNSMEKVICNEQNAVQFFTTLSECMVCVGNDDFHYLVEDKIGTNLSFKSKDGDKDVAIIETKLRENLQYCGKTIRRTNCPYLIPSSKPRCTDCGDYRRILQKLQSRLPKDSTVKSKRPHSTLSKKQLRKRLFNVSKEKTLLKKKAQYLEKKIHKMINDEGVEVDDDANKILVEVSFLFQNFYNL